MRKENLICISQIRNKTIEILLLIWWISRGNWKTLKAGTGSGNGIRERKRKRAVRAHAHDLNEWAGQPINGRIEICSIKFVWFHAHCISERD